MRRSRSFLPILVVALLLTACAKTPGGPPGIDQYKPLLHLGVSLAVDRLLTANDELTPLVVQATRVIEDILNKEDFTSAGEIGAFLRAKIPWNKLDAQVRPFLEAMIDAITEELRVLILQYQIPDSQGLLLAREVMTWARETAQRHVMAPVNVRRVKG